MAEHSYDQLRKIMPDTFKLVVAASQRARGLNLGAKPLVEHKTQNNALIALQEIISGKIRLDLKAAEMPQDSKTTAKS